MPNEFITPVEELVIDEKYKPGAVVRRSLASTVYETTFIEDGTERPAAIKIRELDEAGVQSAIARWRNAMELSHPNLQRLYAAGMSLTDGGRAAYVVMEWADESMAEVLAERALSEDEVREMLEPAVDALRYLHKKGYAHGSLKPPNVLAAGDRLKLSADSAIRVADGGAPEEDMLALGALILDALHAATPEAAGPFADIVQHCVEPDAAKRWTADQVVAQLRSPASALPAGAPQAERAPAIVREPRPSRKTPGWIFAGLAALLLVVFLGAMLRKNDAPRPDAPRPAAPAPVVAQAPVQPAPRPAPRSEPVPAIPRAGGRRAAGWSVIVAAYNSPDAAEKRRRSLAAKWPGFHLSVERASIDSTHYMVVLGEDLSENDAESLRSRAIEAGLPRDTYIKKLM